MIKATESHSGIFWALYHGSAATIMARAEVCTVARSSHVLCRCACLLQGIEIVLIHFCMALAS